MHTLHEFDPFIQFGSVQLHISLKVNVRFSFCCIILSKVSCESTSCVKISKCISANCWFAWLLTSTLHICKRRWRKTPSMIQLQFINICNIFLSIFSINVIKISQITIGFVLIAYYRWLIMIYNCQDELIRNILNHSKASIIYLILLC